MIDRLIGTALEWAAGHHDEGRYSPVAILFHWTMAALILFQLGLGFVMTRLDVGGQKLAAYDLHYAVGVLMLVLAMGRGAWRALAPGPINDADKPGWETTAARLTHGVFYVCLFGLPLTGWFLISATAPEQRFTVAGLIPWPAVPMGELGFESRWALGTVAEAMHVGLVWALIVMLPLHVGGAVKHQLIDRDDVLHGMLPVVPVPTRRRTRWARRWRAMEQWVRAKARARLPDFLVPKARRRRSA
ncbi:MAG TPA: cytochrome b [Brevundimonas sp.]|jgi:cytochrome b561|uniref:cytochrome b n=1 Tax=Brevundimonas sp. TaxID=1871086 RepID=UPI002DEAA8B1|nr:cytochrome b [Brevundimonas sp.]